MKAKCNVQLFATPLCVLQIITPNKKFFLRSMYHFYVTNVTFYFQLCLLHTKISYSEIYVHNVMFMTYFRLFYSMLNMYREIDLLAADAQW